MATSSLTLVSRFSEAGVDTDTNHTFALSGQGDTKTSYTDTASSMTEPSTLEVTIDRKAVGSSGNDRITVKVSLVKQNTNTLAFASCSATLTLSLPRDVQFLSWMKEKVISELLSYCSEARTDSLVIGVCP